MALFLLIILLSGCTNNRNIPSNLNQEKILGRWTATIPNTSLIVTLNFVTNISYYESMNETLIWGTYTMTDEAITLQSGEVTHTYEYFFSNNDNILTLVEMSNEKVYLVLTRQ